jgi:nicotinamide phosphoribosyltransferase
MLEVSNTLPEFAWLTNAIESRISCELWHTMISANIGYEYRQIVDYWYDLTCEDDISPSKALGDFSMRGQESSASAYKSSAAWLLSHLNTATVPAIPYLEKYYNCDCTKEPVGFGAVSTEHSVMCSNAAVDGDEITMVKRLLTEIYPNNSFSMVSDSYDYWRMVDEILPQCKEEIEAHNGCLLVRGDSGDPVDVVTETVFHLGEHFGYTINSKGYKVLNPRIKAIYGDSITLSRAQMIFTVLEENGWAANNVVLGVGSFSMQCLEEWAHLKSSDGERIPYTHLNPFTRDTFGIAIKATHCIMKDGEEHFVFKNPKESTFKKSHKGCCVVYQGEDGELICEDEHKFDETYCDKNELKTVFKNGKMVKEYSLAEIRYRLHGGKF